ncbi:MAG: hypothetical protein WA399_05980 [Acidobacteriaceae bacterium]
MATNPIRNWHQIAVEMIMTDADLALQSITSLFTGDNPDAVARVVHSTREVYDSILAKRKKLPLSATELSALDDKVGRLRARLELMGESV